MINERPSSIFRIWTTWLLLTKKQGNALDKRIVYSVSSPQIKNSLIERASNSISYRSESKALKNAIRKYYKVYENKENKEEYIIRTLMRKGFKYDDIKDLLERYIKNKEK